MSDQIKSELEKIEIPAELHTRVKLGVEQAKPKPFKRVKIGAIAAASILAITLSSGFVNPSMNRVLASTPLLGGIYEKFGDTMGMHLAEQNLVTQLNEAITQNGVTVKLTNVYFDGDVVSITGNVTGDLSKAGEVSFDVNFENNKGDHDPWLANGMSMGIRDALVGYDFQWKVNYPYKRIQENFMLPITIHSINGIKGEWNFEVPLTQDPGNTIALDHTQSYEEGTITVQNLKESNATSTITYEIVSKYERDDIELLKAVDQDGNLLSQQANRTRLSSSKEADGYHQTYRKTIEKPGEGTKSITFYPSVRIVDSEVGQLLSPAGFTLESERTDLAIKVNQVTRDGDKLILDYEFQGLADNLSNHEFEIIEHNLGYNFTLVDKDFVGKIDPENPFPPEGHSISRNEVKVIDRANYVFQSTFKLNGFEDFSVEDTVLRMDFTGFIKEKELAPFTVELPSK